jgi:hypothetical protein
MRSSNVETVFVCGPCHEGRHHNCIRRLYHDGGVTECACASKDHTLLMATPTRWVCDTGNYWLVEVPAREAQAK